MVTNQHKARSVRSGPSGRYVTCNRPPYLVTFISSFLLAAAQAAAQQWTPPRPVEIIVGSGAGGAADRQARVVQRQLQSLPGMPGVVVGNRPGGGGSIAYTFLAQHPAEGQYISTMATSLLTNEITGVSRIGYRDLTPLNILIREYIAVWVRKESPIATATDLLARIGKDPAAVSFAFSTARGNQNHIVIGMIAKAAGVDPKALKIVVYSSGGQGMTAAIGGHVDVWVGTAGSAQQHMQNGTIRMLGLSSPQRQPGALAAVPTLREQGIAAEYFAWRGFAGPKGLTDAQTAFWDQAFLKLVETGEWKAELEKNGWVEGFTGAAAARKHLDAEYELLRGILTELGVAAK
jgi:putative tricarboxylic transport membrane protein